MELTLTPQLRLRTIDPAIDADVCAHNHRQACIASFGPNARYEGRASYLKWLGPKVDEFPEGFVLAYQGDTCVGHLEIEAPYGLGRGYINLFYVADTHRRQGLGTLLHQYVERYFRSWNVTLTSLHVSPHNQTAIQFYRKLGYQFSPEGNGAYLSRKSRLWLMTKTLATVNAI